MKGKQEVARSMQIGNCKTWDINEQTAEFLWDSLRSKHPQQYTIFP